MLKTTLPTIAENLALDEALLLTVEAEGGPAWLRIWEWPDDAVILGSSCRVHNDVDLDACRRDGIPVLRRASGGGSVLLGSGCLNYSLIGPISPEQHLEGIRTATAAILGRIAAALQSAVPKIEVQGTSDLAIEGRKVSGNSQRWLRRSLLHHGTLLYDFPIERIACYLKSPARQPDYRRGRSHAEFVTNLPLPRAELRRRLIDAWQARLPANPILPTALVADLVATKYATDAWNLRL